MTPEQISTKIKLLAKEIGSHNNFAASMLYGIAGSLDTKTDHVLVEHIAQFAMSQLPEKDIPLILRNYKGSV